MTEARVVRRKVDQAVRRYEEVDRAHGWSGDVVSAVAFVLTLWFRDEGVILVVGGAIPFTSHVVRRLAIRGRTAIFRWAQFNTVACCGAICVTSLGTGGLWSPVMMFAPLMGVSAATAYPYDRRWIWLSPAMVAVVAVVSLTGGQIAERSWLFVACLVVSAVAIPRFAWDFVNVEIRMRDQATTDTLTGCLNRSSLSRRFDELLADSNQSGTHLGAVMFDVDCFKRINDDFGHDVGDRILQSISATVRTLVDEASPLFRLGGEEFLVLANVSSAATANDLGERIRSAIERAEFHVEGVTVSVGSTVVTGNHTLEAVLRTADRAMLHAKQLGRNRVMRAEIDVATPPDLGIAQRGERPPS